MRILMHLAAIARSALCPGKGRGTRGCQFWDKYILGALSFGVPTKSRFRVTGTDAESSSQPGGKNSGLSSPRTPALPHTLLERRALSADNMSSDTSHTVCPVKAANPGAHDQWYVDEGKRCERVTKAYLQRIRVADVHYPTRLVEGALAAPRKDRTRVKNAYKALAHVVMGALRQFAVDAEVPDEPPLPRTSEVLEISGPAGGGLDEDEEGAVHVLGVPRGRHRH